MFTLNKQCAVDNLIVLLNKLKKTITVVSAVSMNNTSIKHASVKVVNSNE